jgi:hypothetical protein
VFSFHSSMWEGEPFLVHFEKTEMFAKGKFESSTFTKVPTCSSQDDDEGVRQDEEPIGQQGASE